MCQTEFTFGKLSKYNGYKMRPELLPNVEFI